MDYAANPRRGCTDANPCQGVNLPKQLKPTPKGLMLMQWQAIHVNLVPAGEQDAANLAAFLIGSGWRLGEALALNVASVEDYGKGRPMWVTMSRVLRRNPDGTHTIAEAERKAQKSMRRIELDPATAAIVRARLTGKRHSDLVFTHDGRAWAPHNFRNRLTRARKSAGLENATIHWLRHTHVAWLAMSGAPLPELRKRIGHADITTTIGTYGGMIGDVGAATLGAFAALRDATPTVTNSSPKATIEGSTVSAMKKLALLTALPLLALTACGGDSGGATKTVTVSASPSDASNASASSATSSDAVPSDTSSANQDDGAGAPSESTDSESTEETAGAPLSFGQTYTSKTGRKITVSKPVPYTPSDTAYKGDTVPEGTPYRKVKITLDNASKEPFDTSEVSLTVTSYETTVTGVADSEKGVGESPSGTLLPGRKVSWTEAYPVPAGKNLTIEISTMAGTVAIWDGPAS